MSKSISDLPIVSFTDDDINSGVLPSLLARAALEHGPIFRRVVSRSWESDRDYVFMVGPEANRFVMHTHRDHFSHDLGWTPLIGEDFGHGLLNMDDPEHARHRKMWNPAFSREYLATYLPVLQRVIANHARRWAEQGRVEMLEAARELTFDVAAVALAGMEQGTEVDRLREHFYVLLHGFDGSKETWEEYAQRALHARSALGQHLLRLIAARRAMPPEEQPRDVLGMIVRATDDDGEHLSDAQVLAHVNILLVAGHETTTTLSAWMMYLLATRPDLHARLRAELDELTAGGPITMETIRNAALLDNAIREAGRLYPPVINVPRGVSKEVEFAGYTLPVGTPVRLALAACHRLPHLFEQPDRFDPDRFAPPRDEDRRSPYALVTFGGGPRVCIGINFAQIEVKALVAHVLRSYRAEPIAGGEVIHAGYWTAYLPHGMWLRFGRPSESTA